MRAESQSCVEAFRARPRSVRRSRFRSAWWRRLPLLGVALVLATMGVRVVSADQGLSNAYVIDQRGYRVPIPEPYTRDLALDGLNSETGPFKAPSDVAVDVQDNLYVTDTGNSRLIKYDRDGRVLRVYGDDLQLNKPQGV